MTCRDLTDFLAAYISRDLAPDVQSAFERHLALCANCRCFLQQYEQTVAAGRAACEACDDAPVPDDLVKAILSALKKEDTDWLVVPGFRGSGVPRFSGSEVPRFWFSDAPLHRHTGSPTRASPSRCQEPRAFRPAEDPVAGLKPGASCSEPQPGNLRTPEPGTRTPEPRNPGTPEPQVSED